MRTCFAIFLLTVGCIGESNGSTAEAPTSIVRAQRAEYNAAIAAHDAVRCVRSLLMTIISLWDRRATSIAAEMPQLAATQTRNSKILHSSRTGAPQRPLSLRSPGSGLPKRGVLRASGESLMGQCAERACTLQCGFPTVALGA